MRNNHHTFLVLYGLSWLLSFAIALQTYIQTSFVGLFVPLSFVGWFIIAANAVGAVVIIFFPRLIKRYSNYSVMVSLLLTSIVVTTLLSFATRTWMSLTLFVLTAVCLLLVPINIDVFVEDISIRRRIGRIRTTLLTTSNVAWVIAPPLMGWIAQGERYRLVYLATAAVLAVAWLVLFAQRTALTDHVRYRSRHLPQLLKVVAGNPNLVKIFAVALSLRVFYAIMVLYTPLFLHRQLGFSWTTIGWTFSLMLLPFIIVQLPAGQMADRFLGEKELLVLGQIIMLVFTGLLFFTSATSPLVWAALLFMTRVGAALVDGMQEVYFFKIIRRTDIDVINLFRDVQPAGWLLGALVSVAVLAVFPLQTLFLVAAAVPLLALHPALGLRDTN